MIKIEFLPADVPNPEPVIVITPPEPLLGLTEETVGERDEVNVKPSPGVWNEVPFELQVKINRFYINLYKYLLRYK